MWGVLLLASSWLAGTFFFRSGMVGYFLILKNDLLTSNIEKGLPNLSAQLTEFPRTQC